MKHWIDWTLSILLSLGLLAAAGYFYVSIQRDDATTAQWRRIVEAVRATQGLSEQWIVEVEKVRDEVNSNFDVLADFAERMEPWIQAIHTGRRALPDLPAELKWDLNGYVQRLKAQEERVERFKSGFAIVRNSRRFIPRESDYLTEAARGGEYREIEAAVQRIRTAAGDYLAQPDEVRYQRTEQAMQALFESARDTALRDQADTLNKHVLALLQHYGLTEQRFRDVVSSNLGERADKVVDLLEADHAGSRAQRRYHDYGLWLTAGITVLFWTVQLMRLVSRRRREEAAARALEAAPEERTVPTLGVDAAWAAAGGPDFALDGGPPPGGRIGPEDPADPARRTRAPRLRAWTGEAPAGGRAGPTLEERLKVQRAGRTEPLPAGHEPASPPESQDQALEERLKALQAQIEVYEAMRRRRAVPEDAAPAAVPPRSVAPPAAEEEEGPVRDAQGRAPLKPILGDALSGKEAPEEAPEAMQPDAVQRVIHDALLARLREVEHEVRAAAAAAEKAERTGEGGNGEGRRYAWTAAAGRIAGARWEMRTLLEEADGLPHALAPPELPALFDPAVLVERRLGALAPEDRRRFDAVLAPGALVRAVPRALETAVDLVMRHALAGARLHSGEEGRVDLTLEQEGGGMVLTCLDHEAGSGEPDGRRSLALHVAGRLIEEQGGAMETVPQLPYGIGIRLRLPPLAARRGRGTGI